MRSRLKQYNDFSCWTGINQERDTVKECPGIELDGWFFEVMKNVAILVTQLEPENVQTFSFMIMFHLCA